MTIYSLRSMAQKAGIPLSKVTAYANRLGLGTTGPHSNSPTTFSQVEFDQILNAAHSDLEAENRQLKTDRAKLISAAARDNQQMDEYVDQCRNVCRLGKMPDLYGNCGSANDKDMEQLGRAIAEFDRVSQAPPAKFYSKTKNTVLATHGAKATALSWVIQSARNLSEKLN
jgi:hypothetical protein